MQRAQADPQFDPQFHAPLRRADGEDLWVALPLPYTEVSFKAAFHRACRRDEQRKLAAAGAVVLELPISM